MTFEVGGRVCVLVLVDEVTDEVVFARSAAEAPEVDGVVVIENVDNDSLNLVSGDFVEVTIVGADEHDLFARF
jgi:ribosomal protein S12 methylthiotransferase